MDFHPLGDHFQLPSCGSQPCAADPAPAWTPGSGIITPTRRSHSPQPLPPRHPQPASSHAGPVGPYDSSVPHGSFSRHPTLNPSGGPAGSTFRSQVEPVPQPFRRLAAILLLCLLTGCTAHPPPSPPPPCRPFPHHTGSSSLSLPTAASGMLLKAKHTHSRTKRPMLLPFHLEQSPCPDPGPPDPT